MVALIKLRRSYILKKVLLSTWLMFNFLFNFLFSRACRLKKKAQHEAHKVKLHGLELEHRTLLRVLSIIRKELVERIQSEDRENLPHLSERLEQLIKENLGK